MRITLARGKALMEVGGAVRWPSPCLEELGYTQVPDLGDILSCPTRLLPSKNRAHPIIGGHPVFYSPYPASMSSIRR